MRRPDRSGPAAAALLLVGLSQMAGDLLGLPTLKGLGAATAAAPAPRVFTAVRGYEAFSTRFALDYTDAAGRAHSLPVTPERYAHVRGPYNRRNVYGAALSFAPVDFADLSLGLVLLHLFTFDPAWVPAARPAQRDTVFFDGACGMCHGLVRFLLAEARTPGAFRFAPLHGETFQATLGAETRAALPDSVVVVRADGTLLTRSTAVLHLLARLGGVWRVLAAAAGLVPARVRDAAYALLARVRRRGSAAACAMPPAAWRAHFAP